MVNYNIQYNLHMLGSFDGYYHPKTGIWGLIEPHLVLTSNTLWLESVLLGKK